MLVQIPLTRGEFFNSFEVFYLSEKKRAPSWCDRILWYKDTLRNQKEWVTPIIYTSCMDILISDHKPLYALFKLKVIPI